MRKTAVLHLTACTAETVSPTASPITRELETIPQEYYAPAQRQGTLVELHYDNYESMTYEQRTQALKKRAIVYIPYGYSGDKQYNVFYLMHGG
jgi:enterochelin esterase-like enzyme